MKTNGRYNLMELMVCVAARQLEDGKTAVIGTGMPLAAAMLAQKTESPAWSSCSRPAALRRSCNSCLFPLPTRTPRRALCCTPAWM